MSATDATLLGALLAAFAALVAATIAGAVAIRNEKDRRRAEREAAHWIEIRRRAADVFTAIFVMQHEIAWVAWHAVRDPEAVDAEMVDSYHQQMHAGYPALLGSMAVVCALDEKLYDLLRPLESRIYELDVGVSLAMVGLRDDRTSASALKKLGEFDPVISETYTERPRQMAEALRAVGAAGNSSAR
jgi:hypothetical protein